MLSDHFTENAPPAPYEVALRRLARAEAELRQGMAEEPTTAGQALLRSAAEECRARGEALGHLAEGIVPEGAAR